MKAILPILDASRKEPLYMQLYQYLRNAITAGEIASGERLPSLRSLAKATDLSITTVEKAYDQLLVEGYVHSKPQSGYYASLVSSNQTGGSGRQTVPYENSGSDSKLLSTAGDVVLSATDGAPVHRLYDPDCFDFNKWKKCMNRVLTDHSSALFFESSPQGEAALRIQIARYLYRSRGVSCHPDQIFIGAGTQQITGHLATILRDVQVEHVALEDPGYTPVRNAFRDRGFAITSVDVADDGLVLEKLPVNIRTAVYVSPSNHSFTGAVMPIGRRYELLRWAITNNSYIIEDDYDSELRYFGRPIPALKSLTDDDRVIYLGSFSSTLFTAVKISYMVLPPQIAARFLQKLEGYSQTCSKLEQLTLAMFMETGWYQTHLRKLRKLYAQKLVLVTETIRREASDFIQIRNSDSGITVLLQIDSAKSSDALIRDAESLGIPAALSAGLLSLSYNQIPLSGIEEILHRLLLLWRADVPSCDV